MAKEAHQAMETCSCSKRNLGRWEDVRECAATPQVTSSNLMLDLKRRLLMEEVPSARLTCQDLGNELAQTSQIIWRLKEQCKKAISDFFKSFPRLLRREQSKKPKNFQGSLLSLHIYLYTFIIYNYHLNNKACCFSLHDNAMAAHT